MFHKQQEIDNLLLEEVLNTANLFSERFAIQQNLILEDKIEDNIKLISFLLQADSFTNERKYIDIIGQVSDELYHNNINLSQNMSFIDGRAGIAYVFIQVYETTNDKRYLDRAIELIKSTNNYFLESNYVGDSFFSGRSGLLLIFLYLYDKTKAPEFLEQIDLYTRKIISNAFFYEKGYVWYNPYQLVVKPLCSFGYGAAGIGYVFQELGDYFENPTFKEIANKAFIYVNETSKNPEIELWNDNRKEILDEKDLKEHIENYSKENYSFFETSTLGHSIAHGSSGIIYSQIKDVNVINIDSVFNLLQIEKEETLEVAHLYLNLGSLNNSNNYFEKANFLLKTYKSSIEDDFDCALLKVSILKNKSCLYTFPHLNLDKPHNTDLIHTFLTIPDAQNLLAKKSFNKTLTYLEQLTHIDKNSEDLPTLLINAEEFVCQQIQRIETNQAKLNYIREIFRYEKSLYDSKILQRQNPYYHVKEYLALNKRLKDLDIKDSELMNKALGVSNKEQLHKTYISIKNITELSNLPRKTELFWKFDTEEGVKETPIGIMGFIVSQFNNPKTIEVALTEIILYCFLASEKKLKPLIEYSNSKNKRDLLERLPFLLLYQIRLLIADGILGFQSNIEDTKSFKNKCLKLVLRLFKISINKQE